MRRLRLWCIGFGLWLLSQAALAEPVVEVSQRDNVFQVTAQLVVPAERSLVWQVLTDYLHYPDFFPNVKSTRILERQGNRLILEQRGETGFLVLRIPLDSVLEIAEFPMVRIRCTSIGGTLRINSDTELKAENGATRLIYVATITLDGWAPAAIVKRDVQRQLEALVQETARRNPAIAPARPD